MEMVKIDTKSVLWKNVSSRMKIVYGKENLSRLVGDSKIGPGTASRIKECETSVGVDVLEKISGPLKVQPWQLLHPTCGEGLDGHQNTTPYGGDDTLSKLAGLLAKVDVGRRESVAQLLDSLVKTPDDDGLRIALSALLTPPTFANENQKLA